VSPKDRDTADHAPGSPTWLVSSGWFWRRLFTVQTNNYLHLRRACRGYIGWRRSARLRYRQIGANTFTVETGRGWPVLQIWRI
jgi:hypothetical protein